MTSETAKLGDIYQAMNAVMLAVGYVQKSGRASFGRTNYTYAGEGDLISALRPACVEHGIIIHPFSIQQMHQDSYDTSSGATMNRTAVVITYRFAHAHSDTHFDVTVAGEGADTGDKSSNKAMTGAFKYALRQAFMIETGDDPDKDISEPPKLKPKPIVKATASNGKDLPEPPKPPAAMQRKFHAAGTGLYGDEWDDKRPEFVEAVSKRRDGGKGPAVTSSKELYRAEMQHLIDGMTEKLADRKAQEA